MLTTLESRARRRTRGGDKGYDDASFVAGTRARNATPHVSRNLYARR